MAGQQVIEGTWEEIVSRACELAGSGKRVKLIIPSEEQPIHSTPKNAAAISLLRAWIEEDQRMTPEEREQAAQEWAKLEASIEANPVIMRVPDVE